MEEKNVALESISNEDQEIATVVSHSNGTSSNTDHGWQKVTYAKRQRKTKPSPAAAAAASDSLANGNSKVAANGSLAGGDNVFRSLEQQSEDRRRRILDAQRAAANIVGAAATAPARSKVRSYDDDDEDEDSDAEIAAENGKAEETKKVKPKKQKKPKVTVAEAGAKIDPNHLSAFLAEITVSFVQFWF